MILLVVVLILNNRNEACSIYVQMCLGLLGVLILTCFTVPDEHEFIPGVIISTTVTNNANVIAFYHSYIPLAHEYLIIGCSLKRQGGQGANSAI